VPNFPKPEDLSTYLSDLERRIRLVESTPRYSYSTAYSFVPNTDSVNGGSTVFPLDATGGGGPAQGPQCDVIIGQSGLALVTSGAYVFLNSGGPTAGYGVVTGTTGVGNYNSFGFADLATASIRAASVSGTRLYTGLTPGAATFVLKYFSTGGSVSFTNRFLIVQPL
jgi:hypothetical protein